MSIRVFIDGDAFPKLLKPIVLKAIERHSLKTFVIANKPITIGKSKHIEYIVVDLGADEADHKIVEMVKEEDFVITADIPLADRVISKHAHALDHRGEMYTKENIKQLLAMRDLMASIRDMGEMTKGPKPYSQNDAGKFAGSLNDFLQKRLRDL